MKPNSKHLFSFSARRRAVPSAFLIVTLAALSLPVSAHAQTSGQGRITGVAKDSTNAVLPGTTIVVTNERTGEQRTAVAGPQGLYLVNGLKPSLYTVRAQLERFAPVEVTGLRLVAGQELKVDVTLQPAATFETVTVTAEEPKIDLSSARMGANVMQREVELLPINGRQLSQLYLQAPGAVNTGTGTFGDLRFSGRANQQNAIRYDGIEGTAIIDSSPGNLNGEIPSPFRLQSSLELVQEFRVESNSYPAEYGTGSGGQITVVTKSGGNDFHGSVFEYYRNEALDAPNAFDPVIDGSQQKAPLSQHQYGGSVGGPLAKNKAFFFVSYEGYHLDSGINFIEAVPSDAVRSRADPAVAPLIDAFRGPGSIILPGASANPDFEIAQVQDLATVRENAFSTRFDLKLNERHQVFARYFQDDGTNDQPEGVTGRRAVIKAEPRNAVFAVQSSLSPETFNELRIGYNAASTDVNGVAPTVHGIDLTALTINITGSVANTGIAGQGSSSGVAVPGGLLRQNSATNGRGAPYRPYTLSFMDAYSWFKGAHFFKVGGEVRLVRITTDRLGGTTYTWSSLDDFLANRLQQVQFTGDLSSPSPFNNGATGERQARQEYYVAYIQDEWKARQDLSLNLGLRYEYYTPLHERNNLDVVFSPETGTILPPDTPFYHSLNNFQPRVSFAWSPGATGKTAIRGGFGIYVGPGQTEDQIQPIESDAIRSAITGGAYPVDPAVLTAQFVDNPDNRSYQPRAYSDAYKVPERVYQYTIGFQRELPLDLVLTASYVGSQGRNLFLRSITNQIVSVSTNPDPTKSAIVVRQFDIVQGNTVLRPYGEIDIKTSGGHDSYNALQLSVERRFASGFTMNAQYALARSYGNSAGSNEAQTVGNNAVTLEEFDYDTGYNRFDVRHTFNLSALYALPFGSANDLLRGGWEVGGIFNARSGYPLDLQIVRPDIAYVDVAGNVFSSPAVDRTAVINVPGGGSSRNTRRPDLIPGVDPYIKDGTQWLNPAAFAIPAPGTFGNLKRGDIRGPGFRQVDLLVGKRFPTGGSSSLEFRMEVFNLFNFDNYANPPSRLNDALGTGSGKLQPGQVYTQAAAGSTFGKLTSTVGRTVGLGTNRQIEFALRYNF